MNNDHPEDELNAFGRQIEAIVLKGKYRSQEIFASRAKIGDTVLSRLKRHDPQRMTAKRYSEILYKVIKEARRGFTLPAITSLQEAYVILRSGCQYYLTEKEWQDLYYRVEALFPEQQRERSTGNTKQTNTAASRKRWQILEQCARIEQEVSALREMITSEDRDTLL